MSENKSPCIPFGAQVGPPIFADSKWNQSVEFDADCSNRGVKENASYFFTKWRENGTATQQLGK
ncbi:MAG TPA: hypothetical protein DHU63_12885 [Candidatus Marinimicrobia bacterium]|nr:MAG: hypothetical protein AUJ47_03905 [Candidatus Marinimicrobia bacterium CG1_02_48_14]HCW77415.1 hypothetical protein [Candidatus Neomarinimicrobiota bacterium]